MSETPIGAPIGSRVEAPIEARSASKYDLHLGRAFGLMAVVVVCLVFWESPALLPFKVLAVAGHETGHATASLLAGGSVQTITVRLDQSGSCLSSNPSRWWAQVLVYSAGYVGSAIISVLLLLLTFRFRARRVMLWLAMVWMLGIGVFYARDLVTIGICAGFALVFGLAARFLPDDAVGALNAFIATFTALYAAMDLKDDLWNSAVRSQSDAQLLANITPIPAIVSAVAWTVLSFAVIVAGCALIVRSPKRASGAKLTRAQ